jgi:hypothetical protein
MLNSLRRWMGRESATSHADVAAWAGASGYVFKRVRSGDGFAVEAAATAEYPPWRLEWGPSHRAYIEGQELRVRAELPTHDHLQVLVLSRALLARLEAQTFQTFTDSLKTYADDSAPQEMRWLAMFPHVQTPELHSLRAQFGVVASEPDVAAHWLAGAVAASLLNAAGDSQPGLAAPPLQLMVHRGWLTLRTPLAEPQVPALQARLALFGVALRRLLETTSAG